jgi:nitrogen fixation protein FixH
MSSQKNLWPHGIVAAFGLFIAGTALLIVIACTHKTDLVAADYYEQEIRFQTQLDRLNRTAQLSEQARIEYDGVAQRIIISLPAEHASIETSGEIHFYRPSATGLDREMKLEVDASGAQSVDASSLLPGLWKVRVQWTFRNDEFFTDWKVFITAKTIAKDPPSPIGWERAGVRAALDSSD